MNYKYRYKYRRAIGLLFSLIIGVIILVIGTYIAHAQLPKMLFPGCYSIKSIDEYSEKTMARHGESICFMGHTGNMPATFPPNTTALAIVYCRADTQAWTSVRMYSIPDIGLCVKPVSSGQGVFFSTPSVPYNGSY